MLFISTEHKQIIGKMTGIKETKPKTPGKNLKRGVNCAWGRRKNHKGRRENARRIVENPQRMIKFALVLQMFTKLYLI